MNLDRVQWGQRESEGEENVTLWLTHPPHNPPPPRKKIKWMPPTAVSSKIGYLSVLHIIVWYLQHYSSFTSILFFRIYAYAKKKIKLVNKTESGFSAYR